MIGLILLLAASSWAKEIDPAIMKVVCESAATIKMVTTHKATKPACSVCPSYTSFKGRHENLTFEALYAGHFFRPVDDQMVVSLSGCEPHANGFGGTMVLTQHDNKWQMSSYDAGFISSNCLMFKTTEGRDIFACLESSMNQGTYAFWIDRVSYKNGGLDTQHLLNTIGGNTAGGRSQQGYCYSQEVTSFEKDPAGEGTGFKVQVQQTKGKAPADEMSCGDRKMAMSPRETLLLHFVWDGQEFKVTPDTQPALQSIQDFLKIEVQ